MRARHRFFSARTAAVLLTAGLIAGCADLVLGPERADDPLHNFDLLWEEFDRTYSFFEYKGVDWDSLRTVYRPQVTMGMSPLGLIGVLSSMLDVLKDGHVNIYTPSGGYAYTGWYEGHPDNFDQANTLTYLPPVRSEAGGLIRYGMISGTDIGYIWIGGFSGDGMGAAIDRILNALPGAAAFVVDVRDNGGGSDLVSDAVAGHFADSRRLYRRYKYRNGPGHGDFTPFFDDYIEPAGGQHFTGPVAVLTNRRTFSTAESFVLSMRVMPYVQVVGDTTGGGSGNPVMRELPNGWSYRLSRWIEVDAAGVNHEGIGVFPDVAASISPADSSAGRDTVLETALGLLSPVLSPPARPPGP